MAETGAKAAIQYEITVEGTYYSGTKNNKVHRQYKPEKFVLSTLKDAQHTIMRKLLGERLKVKYDDYVGVRTCNITDTKETRVSATARPLAEIPVAEMNLAQLTQFSIEQGLDVDPQKHGSVLAARKAVSDALDDKHLLQRQQKEEQAKREKDKADKDALGDLGKNEGTSDAAAGEATADPLDQLGTEKDPLEDLE